MAFPRPDADKPNASQIKPTMVQLKRDLVAKCEAAGFDTGFAKYFWTDVVGPYRPQYEQPHVVPIQGLNNAVRWVEPYRERLMLCLDVYLGLSESDRKTLHAGVEDGVKWQGEPMTQYVDICNETMKMRSMPKGDYMRDAIERLNKRKARARRESTR